QLYRFTRDSSNAIDYRRAIALGFTVGISNPKDLLFFGALFPNFIDLGQPQWSQFAILALTWVTVDLAAMTTYASVGSTVSRWFGTPRRVRVFNRTTGGLFVAAGGALATSHR
ncbi:LysE family translocator, partial [Kushneria aurantia]